MHSSLDLTSHPLTPLPISWSDLLGHRDYMVRFAKRSLHDTTLAEDLVHDVFEAVITGRALFCGRSALRSWLTAILKHKIVDVIRHKVRFDSLDNTDAQDNSSLAQTLECPLPRPEDWAEHRERLQHTLHDIQQLPSGLRDVMQLRVLDEESSDTVCQKLQISESSLFVRLHRARKQLQERAHYARHAVLH
jgi:RNA polymerase sigma-70 factor, ECF subfamily